MKIKLICIWIGFFLLTYCQLQGQDTVKVYLKTSVGKESVKLRWVVDQPHLWKKTNHKGFIIERFTDVRNGIFMPQSEKRTLTDHPLKAAPVNDWESIAQKNAYAAVIAQALYGDSFQVTGLEAGEKKDPISLSQEEEQRYSFALYAADMCFEAACLAGWGYEDKDVRPGECYLYRVIPVDLDTLPFQYGFQYVCMDEYEELPRPVGLNAEFGDRSVSLTWNGELLKSFFTAYQIEKSEDNSRFEPLSVPVVSLAENVWGHSSYMDTLPQNDVTYYYRIRGITPFGETGPPSDTIQGKGKSSLKFFPRITRSIVNALGQAEIDWEFNPEGEQYIQSFSLRRSAGEGEKEEIVASASKERRQIITDKLLPSNYFSVAAELEDGTSWTSYPVLLMPVDSVPPSAPVGLVASVDTSGVVSLRWTGNTEPDLLGYKIYRAFREGDEPVSVNTIPVEQAFFTDTVSVYLLNEFVCYQVKALDQRYNQSEPSALLKVEKPLKVQPAPPVISGYESRMDGIYLEWINNPDKWVTHHTLYRQGTDSLVRIPVKVFNEKEITSFTDSLAGGKAGYRYSLTATSKWGVESEPSPTIQVVFAGKMPSGLIAQFKARTNQSKKGIELSWKTTDTKAIESLKLYRSEGQNKFSLWKELSSETTSLIDLNVQVGIRYNYMIVAVLRDGGFSGKSEDSTIY